MRTAIDRWPPSDKAWTLHNATLIVSPNSLALYSRQALRTRRKSPRRSASCRRACIRCSFAAAHCRAPDPFRWEGGRANGRTTLRRETESPAWWTCQRSPASERADEPRRGLARESLDARVSSDALACRSRPCRRIKPADREPTRANVGRRADDRAPSDFGGSHASSTDACSCDTTCRTFWRRRAWRRFRSVDSGSAASRPALPHCCRDSRDGTAALVRSKSTRHCALLTVEFRQTFRLRSLASGAREAAWRRLRCAASSGMTAQQPTAMALASIAVRWRAMAVLAWMSRMSTVRDNSID